MSPYLLLFFGMLLIFLEFYVPGAVMGVCGGLMVFVSIILFAMQSQSIGFTLLYIIGAIVSLVILFKFALWRIRTAKPGQSIFSDSSQEGFFASHVDTSVIGKKGIVDTDLKPSGHIIVDGKRLQAISQSGYITKGSEVLVIGGQEANLIVKLSKKETLA
ncbi:MAG: serine protease [Parachlamydiaceae bacterium]|nr:serine protease [Parachlamydiaceae bacterium]